MFRFFSLACNMAFWRWVALFLIVAFPAVAQPRNNGGYFIQGGQVLPGTQTMACRRWAIMGDSIMANAGIVVNGAGTQVPPTAGWRTQASQGTIAWLPFVSNGNIDIQPDGNFAVSGYTTTQILATLPNVLAYKPCWVLIDGGTNDPGGSIAPATSIANLQTIYAALQNANINVVRLLVTPRQTPNSYTTAENQNLAAINTADRRWAANHSNIILVDMRTNGYGNLTGGVTTGTDLDGLHPNQTGAQMWATTIWNAVSGLVTPTPTADPTYIEYDLNDTYDAVQNPTGNVLSNILFATGTGGSVGTNSHSAATFTNVPANWSASFTGAGASYTGTLTTTTVARADHPGQYWKIVAASLSNSTGGTTGTQDKLQLFQQVNLPAGWAPGMYVQADIQVLSYNCTSGGNGFDVDIGMSDGTTASTVVTFETMMGPATNASAWPQQYASAAYTGVLRTQKFLIGPANGASQRIINMFVNVYFDTSATGPATCTIELASPNLHIRTEP